MTDELALLQREELDGGVVVYLSGEIDLSNADELRGRIHRELTGARLAIVDLAAISYIDSQGLRLLQRLADQLDGEGSTLEVVAPPDSIARDVLEMTGMSEGLAVRDALVG